MGNRSPGGACATDFLAAGEVAEITVILYPTSNVFSRGNRIRRDASSSNFPRFDVNPTVGETIRQERGSAPVLPVIPA